MKRPVAPKLREIDGQANDSSTSESSSEIPRAASVTVIVPPLMRISENDSTVLGLAGARLERARERRHQAGPVRAAVRLHRDDNARACQRHVGRLDPADQQRQQLQLGGQPIRRERRGRLRSSPSTTSEKLTVALGNSETVDVAADRRLEPGGGADLGDDRAGARVSAGISARGGDQRADPGREHGRNRQGSIA